MTNSNDGDNNNNVCRRLNSSSDSENNNNNNNNNLIVVVPPCRLSVAVNNNSQRNSPCRLFIPSAESQRICIICGFHEVDHYQSHHGSVWSKKKPPLPPGSAGGCNNNNNKALVNCPYDIRVEYLPRSSFQAKYGGKLPVVLNDDNYVQLRTSSSFDQQTSNDSEPVGHQFQHSYSSDKFDSFLLSKQQLTIGDDRGYSSEDMIRNPIMLSPSNTSAFDEYQPPFEETKNGRKKPPPPPPPPPKYAEPMVSNQRPAGRNSVSFQPTDNIISCEGGQEYFLKCENDKDTDEEFEDLLIAQEESDLDDTDWISDKKCEFDKMTQSNTEFNANPKNLAVLYCQQQKVITNVEKAAKFIDREMKKDLKINISMHQQKNESTKNGAKIMSGNCANNNNNNNNYSNRRRENGGDRAQIDSIVIPVNVKNENSTPSTTVVVQTKSANHDDLSSRDSTENSSTIVTVKGPIGYAVGRPQSLNLDVKNGAERHLLLNNNNNNNNLLSCQSENSPSPSKDLSELSSNLSSSADISLSPDHQVTVTLRKPPLPTNGSFNNQQPLPMYTGRKTGKFNKNIDERLKKMAMDLETQRKGPKRPAPPPPPPSTVDTNGNGGSTVNNTTSSKLPTDQCNVTRALNKSNSTAVMPSKRNSMDSMFTVDINVCQHLPLKKPFHHNGRSVSQDRSLRSTPESTTVDSLVGGAGRTSKFASIRKFLKFEQKLMNNDSKFQSLRRFPSPFARNRIDIGQIKGLFHGVEKCTAADEIAQDSDVVVTDITEVHSNVNTLNRNEQKENENALLKPPYPINDDHRYPSPSNESLDFMSSNNSQTPVTPVKEDVKKTYPIRRVARESSPNVTSAIQNGYSHQNLRRSVDLDFVEQQQMVPRKEVDYRKLIEENYDQMTMGHVMALSHVAEHYPDLAFRWKRKASAIINLAELKWSDFVVVSCAPTMITESAAFYPGVLKLEQELPEVNIPKVNIMVTPIKYSNPMAASYKKNRRPFFLPVIADFQEYVSSKLLRLTNLEEDSGSESPTTADNEQSMTLCKISILPRLVLTSLESYADQSANRHHPLKQPTLHEKDVCFIMIQFITALKYLQSQGIEEVASDFDGFFLIRPTSNCTPQLVLCWETFLLSTSSSSQDIVVTMSKPKTIQQRISLCQSALACLCLLLHTEVPTEELIREKRVPDFGVLSTYTEGFQKVADVLNEEKSYSLTQSKSLLEHMYWVSNHSSIMQDVQTKFDSEFAAKMWLENERGKQVSNILKLILKQLEELDIVEEYRIQFLLHTSAKQLFDASVLLDERREVIIV